MYPFTHLLHATRDLERIFADVTRQRPPHAYHNSGAINLARNEAGDIRIRVPVPGLAADQIIIDLDNDDLVISTNDELPANADHSDTPDHTGAKVHRRERPQSTWRRRVHLPFTPQPEAIQASVHNGLLTISVTAAPAATPTRIPVLNHTTTITNTESNA